MSKILPAIFLMGPTASGKTGLAVKLYQHLPIELISVDSALVFKGMDIGTAKPDAATLRQAPHHLIDLISPTQVYSAAHFRHDALKLMSDISARGKVPLLVGGTMLYFKALQGGLSNLPEADLEVRAKLDAEALQIGWPAMHAKLAKIDPATAARLKPADAQRVQRALEVVEISGKTMTELHQASRGDDLPYRLLKVALVPSDRSVLHSRIATRFDDMLKQGFLGEVKALLKQYPELNPEMPSMRCVGYRQALEHLAGQYDVAELRDRGIFATRQLAKRQLTWLRGMDDTVEIDCLNPQMYDLVFNKINQFIKD
jgi:tRNA dimethylallyltransferase